MFQVSRKGSRDVADHTAIQMDDSDSITVSEQSEPSAECWQNMYKLLNFYSLISDPTGILEKSSPENCITSGNQLGQFSLSNLKKKHTFPLFSIVTCFSFTSPSSTTSNNISAETRQVLVSFTPKSAPKILVFTKFWQQIIQS